MNRIVGWPLGIAALLISLIGLVVDRRMFFAAWLAAWWFGLGLMFGAAAWQWIHRLTGGAWGLALRPASRSLLRRLPCLALLLLPLLFGLPTIYPWAGADAGWTSTMTRPAFAQAWFALPFVGARWLCFGAGWWWLARTGRVASAGQAAAALGVYMLLASLCAVDLLMSLVPAWTSTVFGWLTTIGQMAAGAAAAILLTTRQPPASASVRVAGKPPVWRDLGNLLLMALMLQAYLQFMEFLIIWAEDLPREISWYLPRLQSGWQLVGLSLMLLQFALPVAALLWRRNKDEPRRLARVAAGVLLMQAVDAAWLVVPSIEATGWNAWWLLPLVFGGMGLLLFGKTPALARPASGGAFDAAA
jgi:hypothetical protein